MFSYWLRNFSNNFADVLNFQKIGAFFVLCVFAFALSGCDKCCNSKSEEAIRKTKDGKEILTVLISPDNPPFSFVSSVSDGEKFDGLEIEIMRIIAEDLNLELEFVQSEFSAIIPSLNADKGDVGVASIAITSERKKSVDFSGPYHSSAIRFVSKIRFESEDLSKALNEKKLGVQIGSVMAEYLVNFQKSHSDCKIEIMMFDTLVNLMEAFSNGIVDIIAVEMLTPLPNYVFLIDVKDTKSEIAIAMKKGSKWVEKINGAIDRCQDKIEALKKDVFDGVNPGLEKV